MQLFTRERKASHRKAGRAGRAAGLQKTKELLAGILIVIAFAALVRSGAPLIQRSSLFELKELKIFGCSLTAPEDLAAHARIVKGMNLLAIDLNQKSAQLEEYPYIYKAVLERTLPGTLEIRVQERKPRALIRLDALYLVDERGEVFKKALDREQRYPVLSGLSKDDLYRDSDHCRNLICTALELLAVIDRDQRFKGTACEIVIDKSAGFTIKTAPDPMEIYLGFGDFTDKMESLWKIVDDLKNKGMVPETVHLKSTQKAYVTVKG
jgi:cell division protein FtsQ